MRCSCDRKDGGEKPPTRPRGGGGVEWTFAWTKPGTQSSDRL